MSEMKTLREICERTGAPRRAIQGYEKAGLVKPVGRNKYGYLLYDDGEEEKIRKIRFLQRIGFTVREIEVIFRDDDETVREKLLARVKAMEDETRDKMELIEKTKKILEEM